jgi:hypothetical protein
VAYNDVWQITDKQRLFGQRVDNTYFYRNNQIGEGGLNSEDLANTWVSDVLPTILAIQPTELVHEQLVVQNLFNVADYFALALSEVGETGSGDATMPSFNAYGFSLVQDNGAIKNGSKRIAGVQEAAQEEGVITNATYMGFLDDIADILIATLIEGILPTWVPTIVKRILVTPGIYRLPANSGEAVLGSVVEAVWNTLVTSQVSRKVGVGE